MPNQLVYRRNYTLSDKARFYTAKLAPRYVGSLFIMKKLSLWTYELRDESGISKGISKDLKSASADENLME